MATIVQLKDEHTGNDIVPITHWDAITNKPNITSTNKSIHISSYIQRAGDEVLLYVAVPESVDITGYTIEYYRKGRVNWRKHRVLAGYYKHTTGWHKVKGHYPQTQNPLILVRLNLSNSFTKNYYSYYLVQFYDHVNDIWESDFDTYILNIGTHTGYGYTNDLGVIYPVHLGTILSKRGGICLMNTDEEIVSDFAEFKAFEGPDGVWTIAP